MTRIKFNKKLVYSLILLSFLQIQDMSSQIRAQTIEAQWQVHQVRFRYFGFGAHYTCAGIETTLRRLLKVIGARDDVRVENSCFGSNEVQRFHRINLAFALPVPADKSELSKEIIPAEWQAVKLNGRRARYLDEGDCELIEQFYRHVMPKLGFKQIKNRMRCIPRRRDFNSLNLSFMALRAVEVEKLEETKK